MTLSRCICPAILLPKHLILHQRLHFVLPHDAEDYALYCQLMPRTGRLHLVVSGAGAAEQSPVGAMASIPKG